MDVLKAQFDRIQQQLSGLGASQKMLTASLVAIMVMTLLWFGRYAGAPEMVPVLDQALNSDQIVKARTKLQVSGISYQVQGDRILVPADRQWEAIAILVESRAMPNNTQSAMDGLLKNISPFTSHAQTQEMFNQAKAAMLSQIIGHMEGVAHASVIIDPTNVRRIGSSIQSSATVAISMESGAKAGDDLVESAAHLVSGAQAGLSADRVKVIVDGRTYSVRDRKDGTIAGGNEILKQLESAESQVRAEIERALSFIPNVIVGVSIDIDTESSQSTVKKLDPKNLVHQPRMTSERSEESTSAQAPGGEGGVAANVGTEVPSFGGNNTSSEVRDEQAEFAIDYGQTVSNVVKPAGKPTVQAVSVGCPRSYFVSIYRSRTGSQDEPDDVKLKPFVDAQLEVIRKMVAGCVGPAVTELHVGMYADALPTFAAALPAAGAASTSLGLVNNYAKELVVGVLAVVSLFMVSMMVRKGVGGPALAAPRELSMPPQLQASETLAGEVSEGDTLLDGMELDEESVRTQQVVSQVQSMVKEDPEAAAALVKRWLNRT